MLANTQSSDNDGWSHKKTRQQKRNVKKPKVPSKQNPQKPNKKKLTRNQRRKRNKLGQNQLNEPDAHKRDAIETVIQQITACYPRFKSDRNILETVIHEMELKSFDANNLQLKADVLECINKIKINILTENIEEDDDNIKLDDITPKGLKTQTNGDHLNNIEQKDEEEEEEYDDVDMDEDEEEHDDDDDDADESLEQKESLSSESPQKSVSMDDDKEESKSSQREEPQRKKKRKRARKRRKKDDEDETDNKDKEEHSFCELQERNRSESPTTKLLNTQMKQKPNRKKKQTLNDNLKCLDLRDVISAKQKLGEWIILLRNPAENKAFLTSFIKADGIEIIVEKFILNDTEINKQYNALIVNLFEIFLCGTRDYHQWLFSTLMKLGQKLKDLNVNSQSNSNNHTDLVSIISKEARNLVRAQSKNFRKSHDIIINRDESFSRPSHLLHGGHPEKDPIVSVLNSLDEEVSTLSDLFNNLLVHDSTFSSKVNYDLSGYAAIKSVLRENINIIGHKSANLEQELFAMKNEQNELSKRKDVELMNIRQGLENRKSEKYQLLAEKKRIEQELMQINESLKKNEMLQEEANVAMLEITNAYSPKMESLYESMHDHQFEIAGYAQESSCFSLLLQMTQESYNLLNSFRDNLDLQNNQRRTDLESNYINHLARYLDKLCEAVMMVCNRQNELKQHIESFKKTNETTNKYYALSLNITQQLAQYKNMLNVDEKTNVNISGNISKNIEKAKKIVSKNLFTKFINHLKQNPQIANVIDLTKYTIDNDSNSNTANVNKDKPTASEHAHVRAHAHTHTAHTTHVTHAAHPHSHSHQHSHPHPHSHAAQQINGRSKPPFIKNKAPSMRRPPRPHYQQQSQQQQQQQTQQQQSPQNPKRRPPAHSKYRQQF